MFFYKKKKHKKKKGIIASGFSLKKNYGLTTYEFKKLCESIEINNTVKHIKIKEDKYAY